MYYRQDRTSHSYSDSISPRAGRVAMRSRSRRRSLAWLALSLTVLISGCATSASDHPADRQSREEFQSLYGAPDPVITLDDGGSRWFVKARPTHVDVAAGRYRLLDPRYVEENWVADFDRDGRLLRQGPALTRKTVASVVPGTWTRSKVTSTFGNPQATETRTTGTDVVTFYRATLDLPKPGTVVIAFDSNNVVRDVQVLAGYSPPQRPAGQHP